MLLGRPWLRSTNIKQNWKYNCISFRQGRSKVRIPTEEITTQPKGMTPLYAEIINMLDGMDDTELEAYLEEHSRIIPLFEIYVIGIAAIYATPTSLHDEAYEPDPASIMELSRAREAFEKEMEISRRVTASALEDVNIGTTSEPRLLSIAKELAPNQKQAMIALLTEYKDVFAWSHEDMKGLDPKFYQHKINLAADAKPVQQRRYRMNPNYAAQVKEEIDKLLKAGFIRPVKQATWLSPIVVVPKKNGKIRVCIDY